MSKSLMAKATSDRKQFYPRTRAAWRKWLEVNHSRMSGVWLIYYKKATGKPTVTYDESVEEAVCFGWIDSHLAKLDDERHMLLFTPRKPKSGWSKTNKDRIKRLSRAGLMAEAGLVAIATAKKNGSWTMLDNVEKLIVPADLAATLAANSFAKNNFDDFSPSVRKGLLAWIESAKRPETRARRIDETVRCAEKNVVANQPQA